MPEVPLHPSVPSVRQRGTAEERRGQCMCRGAEEGGWIPPGEGEEMCYSPASCSVGMSSSPAVAVAVVVVVVDRFVAEYNNADMRLAPDTVCSRYCEIWDR